MIASTGYILPMFVLSWTRHSHNIVTISLCMHPSSRYYCPLFYCTEQWLNISINQKTFHARVCPRVRACPGAGDTPVIVCITSRPLVSHSYNSNVDLYDYWPFVITYHLFFFYSVNQAFALGIQSMSYPNMFMANLQLSSNHSWT